jgi:hypothetical protein
LPRRLNWSPFDLALDRELHRSSHSWGFLSVGNRIPPRISKIVRLAAG